MRGTSLRSRWQGEEERVSAILVALRRGEDWTQNLLAIDGRWRELAELHTCCRERLASEAAPRDLRGIVLEGVDLSRAQGLADACLDFASLRGVNLRGSSLRGATLRFAEVSAGSVLDQASMEFSDCRQASFEETSLRGVDFFGADIRGAYFSNCDLESVRFKQVRFSRSSRLVGALAGCPRTRFKSATQTTKCWSLDTDIPLRRHARVEIAKQRLKLSHPLLAAVDLALTDYGRSPGRLFAWTILFWLFFGVLFAAYPLPRFLAGTDLGHVLCGLRPEFEKLNQPASRKLVGFEPFYLSAITLAGFGHSVVVPATGNISAHLYVFIEIVVGYILFGGVVALLVQNVWVMEE